MKRWALRILSVALVAVAAGASWHAYSLRTDLESQTAELNALELRLSETEDMHADAKHQLLINHQEFTGMAKELKAARAEIRRRQPCPSFNRLWLHPSSGPPGTRVHFRGYCFTTGYPASEKDVRNSAYGMFLIRQLGDLHPSGECEQLVGVSPFEIEIRRGVARGSFTVQDDGHCFQHGEGPYPVVPGEYTLGIGCHACSTSARFRVTS